jgi:two-component system, cell cycle sensor histidine kinase and response regulator CckA
MTTRHRHKDGSWRLLDGVARNLLEDPAVRGIVVNARDVTEQRRLEEEFRQAQKLESIGRLAGGVAHDFNNVLTVILSSAESLKSDLESGTRVDLEYIDEIQAAGKRASDLTRQLLAFARKQVIAPVPLALNTVVQNSEKWLRRILREDINLVVSLQPDLWQVRCDPGQIEQVIMNLVVNGRDAMPGGGKLTIETTNTLIEESHLALYPFMHTGPFVRLAIRDSGVGMTPEVKAHLFEPFFTTKAPGEGTGLGLATVYGIVKQSSGFIVAESEVGHGAVFEVYFPRILEKTAAMNAPSATPKGGTETVLLVEDDPQVRKVTVRTLLAGGYRVLVASNGREALDVAARELEGALDLLVTDVIMPGMNGRAVADELRRVRSDLRVLYVSGYTRDAISEAGVLDSGIEFLQKPFTAAALLDRVRAVLDSP